MRYYISKAVPIATIIGYFSFPGRVFATEMCEAAGPNFASLCNIKLESNAGGITGAIVQMILIIGILVSMLYLVWGGVRWAMSSGDRAKVAAARGHIVHALIGLVIAFSAFMIINFLLQFFLGTGFNGLSIPKLVN